MNLSKIKTTEILVGILYMICFLCGFIGFSQYYNLHNEYADFWKRLFFTLQLFVFENSITHDRVPVLLTIARFMAPLLLAGTILNLLFSSLINQTNLFIIKHKYKNHIIFCGLGHKSFFLIKDYLKTRNDKIVVIEKDPENLLIKNLNSSRVRFITGNAEDPDILIKANIRHSSIIFALTEIDKTNINITRSIIDIFIKKKIKKPIKIILHISDHFNMNIFKEFQERNIENVDFHAFNIYQKISSLVVSQYSPDQYRKFTGQNEPQCHILVHGLNKFGEQIIKEAIHLYHFADLRKLRITVVDENVEDKAVDFRIRFPLIDQVAELQFINISDLLKNYRSMSISAVSVCFIFSETDSQSYETAKRYRQIFFKLRLENAPVLNGRKNSDLQYLEDPRIVILLPRDPDILNLFENVNSVSKDLNIDRFAYYDNVCNKKMIADDEEQIDSIAMQIHNIYLKVEDAELMQLWEKLTDREKDFNRYPARHLAIKLRYLSAALVGVQEPGEEFEFEKIPGEKKLVLAKMEHNRWVAEKILGGFMPVEEISDVEFQSKLKKGLSLHKDIIPWEELSKADRNKDSIMTDNIKTIVSTINKKLIRT